MSFDLSKIADDKREGVVTFMLDALAAVAGIVGGAKGDTAREILTVLKVIFQVIDDVYKGDLDPKEAYAQISRLKAALASNDEAADAALKAKFP